MTDINYALSLLSISFLLAAFMWYGGLLLASWWP